MKKIILVVVVIIAILIIGIFALAYLSKSGVIDKEISNLETKRVENRLKINEVLLQSATIQVALLVDDFYQKHPTQGFVEGDPETIGKINDYLLGIKNKNGIDIEYYIHTSKSDYVIKTREINSPTYYCMDFLSEDITPRIVSDVQNSFSKSLNCSGLPMK